MRRQTFDNRCEHKSQYEDVKMNKYINMTKKTVIKKYMRNFQLEIKKKKNKEKSSLSLHVTLGVMGMSCSATGIKVDGLELGVLIFFNRHN